VRACLKIASVLLLASAGLRAQTGQNVLLVFNQSDATSRAIADYYRPRRSIPIANVCPIRTAPVEEISWETYLEEVEKPVAACLRKAGLAEKILYLVTTLGVPLKVEGRGSGLASEQASVDSELTLLYGKLKGQKVVRGGAVANPFFRRRDDAFTHDRFPIYLVTRLAAYDLAGVKAMVDRSLAARNRGQFVIDLEGSEDKQGNDWLRTAAMLMPAARVRLDETKAVLYGLRDVIGYASWGSNDSSRNRRFLGYQWLPGAIVTEYVSTNARTFHRPPPDWNVGPWGNRANFWEGSPQSLSADYIQEGATGCSGHVYEPYLTFCPRPEYVLPAYYGGRNLAESYYLGIPGLSWQNIVLGDPLTSLGKP
jgi:uncharacterized protein (TIGR03790 family)